MLRHKNAKSLNHGSGTPLERADLPATRKGEQVLSDPEKSTDLRTTVAGSFSAAIPSSALCRDADSHPKRRETAASVTSDREDPPRLHQSSLFLEGLTHYDLAQQPCVIGPT